MLGSFSEWRFCGHLGFGGKFRFPGFWVDCYPEDISPEREKVIQEANSRLQALRAEISAAGLL